MPDANSLQLSELLDVLAVAAMLVCSSRHVYRLAESGKMPAPVKLGSLVRWRRAELLDWLERGCPQICCNSEEGEAEQ